MALDLKGKTWPVDPHTNPEFDLTSPHLRDTVKYHHRSFVREGMMVAMPLGFPGITTPIPADECATVALSTDRTRMVYGGTRGRAAHAFAAMTRAATGMVHDLGAIPGATACPAVMPDADRTLWLVTAGPDGGKIWKHPPVPWPYDCLQEWGFDRPGYTEVAHPFADEGIAHAVLDEGRRTIYGVSARTGTFFAFDMASGAVAKQGKVDGIHRFSKRIVHDAAGRVWGTAANGSLWRFDPDEGKVVDTGTWIPAVGGREIHNHGEAFALDPVTGIIYGSAMADGCLYAFDPATERVRSIGKPGVPQTIRCLTVGNDGRLFGICGGDDDIGQLFVYDPATGDLGSLGVPIALWGVRAYGYVFGAAITGADGEIIFGQAERMSHLWIYFPAVPKRAEPVREEHSGRL